MTDKLNEFLNWWDSLNPALVVIALVVIVLIIPCRYDPAIQLKEWMIRKGRSGK